MEIKKHLWTITTFVVLVELENLWHSKTGVLAHGRLNEQMLCETREPYLITHEVPSSLRQELSKVGGGWEPGRSNREFVYYDIISKIKKGVPRRLNWLNVCILILAQFPEFKTWGVWLCSWLGSSLGILPLSPHPPLARTLSVSLKINK